MNIPQSSKKTSVNSDNEQEFALDIISLGNIEC